MMDLGAIFQAAELVATQPNFSFLTTIRDVSNLRDLSTAVKSAGKFDAAALDKAGLLGPSVDAAARLLPYVAKLKADPNTWPQVVSLLASFA